ncbi:MAG: hypothetical protein V5A38_05825 [Halolamina sp.]|uniref:hypothetical protein n=1 Tax=Halolamina sp. TaxID=1940283 RepID=UPI002FC3938A
MDGDVSAAVDEGKQNPPIESLDASSHQRSSAGEVDILHPHPSMPSIKRFR